MGNILLIDADSTIPNLPLMKLATWHKKQGDFVYLVRLELPYYPSRKRAYFSAPVGFDKYYCSVIFEGNKRYIKGEDIIFGGTGHDLITVLPEEVEQELPDYSIYPGNDTSYGFLSRGCIRRCAFCKVPEKEGGIKEGDSLDYIIQHKRVKFLDNNFLAFNKHKSLLGELSQRRIRCCFNQGLDIRLLDEENSRLLRSLNYIGEYTFAFDDIKIKPLIEAKIPLLQDFQAWSIRFFMYTHHSMAVEALIERILWAKKRKFLPYVMRDRSIWGTELQGFYSDVAAWCNQPGFFKTHTFEEFTSKRHPIKTAQKHIETWRVKCR